MSRLSPRSVSHPGCWRPWSRCGVSIQRRLSYLGHNPFNVSSLQQPSSPWSPERLLPVELGLDRGLCLPRSAPSQPTEARPQAGWALGRRPFGREPSLNSWLSKGSHPPGTEAPRADGGRDCAGLPPPPAQPRPEPHPAGESPFSGLPGCLCTTRCPSSLMSYLPNLPPWVGFGQSLLSEPQSFLPEACSLHLRSFHQQ